jgi:hypothetical protein
MIKKGNYLLVLLALIILLQPVKANFVCGEVQNTEKISASWIEVLTYYSEDPAKISTCKISPENNRYCCDPLSIADVDWQVGKQINAEIFDAENGYVSNPVNLQITGEGYDVFPIMQLEEAISINSPNTTIISDSEVLFNVSIASRFNQLKYLIGPYGNISEKQVCSNCSEAVFSIQNLDFGQHEITFIASNEEQSINRTIFLTRAKSAKFSRDIKCNGCTGNYVPVGKKIEMIVSLNLSSESNGFLIDYFPVDWQFISSDGAVEPFTETHNLIKWNVQGKQIVKNYTLKSPNKLATRKYLFQSTFETFEGSKDEIILFRIYKFFPYPVKFLYKQVPKYDLVNYAEISPSMPLILFFKENDLEQIAIFPKNETKDAYAYIQKISTPAIKNIPPPFAIHTSLAEQDIEKILIRFKAKKEQKNSVLANISLLKYDEENETWSTLDISQYNEDKDNFYYESYSAKKGIFAIKSEYER